MTEPVGSMALTGSHVFKEAQLNQEDPVGKSMHKINEELRRSRDEDTYKKSKSSPAGRKGAAQHAMRDGYWYTGKRKNQLPWPVGK